MATLFDSHHDPAARGLNLGFGDTLAMIPPREEAVPNPKNSTDTARFVVLMYTNIIIYYSLGPGEWQGELLHASTPHVSGDPSGRGKGKNLI